MTPYKLLAGFLAMLAMLAAVALYGHRQYNKGVQLTTLRYETAIAKQKAAAAEQLAVVTTQIAAKEQILQLAKDKQNITDAQHTKTINTLSGKLRVALNASSGLCDGTSAGCGLGGGGTSVAANCDAHTSSNDTTGCGRIFSAGVADLLEQLTFKADAINNAYTACRADAIQIRTVSQ